MFHRECLIPRCVFSQSFAHDKKPQSAIVRTPSMFVGFFSIGSIAKSNISMHTCMCIMSCIENLQEKNKMAWRKPSTGIHCIHALYLYTVCWLDIRRRRKRETWASPISDVVVNELRHGADEGWWRHRGWTASPSRRRRRATDSLVAERIIQWGEDLVVSHRRCRTASSGLRKRPPPHPRHVYVAALYRVAANWTIADTIELGRLSWPSAVTRLRAEGCSGGGGGVVNSRLFSPAALRRLRLYNSESTSHNQRITSQQCSSEVRMNAGVYRCMRKWRGNWREVRRGDQAGRGIATSDAEVWF